MIRDGWYCCPDCRKKLFPVGAETVVRKLRLKCKACTHIIEVNIPEPRATEPRAD